MQRDAAEFISVHSKGAAQRPVAAVRLTGLSAVLAALMLTALAAPDAKAQRPLPYATVSAAGGVLRDARDGTIHPFWSPEYTGALFLSTPTHLGHLELGGSMHRYQPVSDGLPSFDAVFAYAAWDVGVRFPPQVRWAVGPRLGIYFMDFDVDALGGHRTESELGLGAHARVTVHPLPFIGLYAGAEFMQTYTYVRMRLYHFSYGLVLTIKSPEWLVKVLR